MGMENKRMAVVGFFAGFVLVVCVLFVGVFMLQQKEAGRQDAYIERLNEEIRRFDECSRLLTSTLEQIRLFKREQEWIGYLLDRLNLLKEENRELQATLKDLRTPKEAPKAAKKEEKPYISVPYNGYLLDQLKNIPKNPLTPWDPWDPRDPRTPSVNFGPTVIR